MLLPLLYLKVLIRLGIIKKEIPVTEVKSKKTIYGIADNFFSFSFVLLGIVTFVIPRLPTSVAIADQQPLALQNSGALRYSALWISCPPPGRSSRVPRIGLR